MRIFLIGGMVVFFGALGLFVFGGPIVIPVEHGGQVVIALPWHKMPEPKVILVEQKVPKPVFVDQYGNRIDDLAAWERQNQQVKENLVPVAPEDRAGDRQLTLDRQGLGAKGAGISKCRSTNGLISYQSGPCPDGLEQVKELTVADTTGGTVSLQHHVQAQKALEREEAMRKPQVAEIGNSKSRVECKQAIEQAIRSHSLGGGDEYGRNTRDVNHGRIDGCL
ncbi:hypothetical protein [Chitiniphilus eburneus]|uniref:DUF4124 domain-containing protein n=1 Tax=Chitiniphilus eburneus TaxID=2571148 RepID=A0A4U0Q515_9NEIS|nr:hypothetical protein [Chitiniphilus eburneus]TJZ76253.1 hypothetical protein FAZ21_05615 [Chitiniphilus eburneus]